MPAGVLYSDYIRSRERRVHRSLIRAAEDATVERVRQRATGARERVHGDDGRLAVRRVQEVRISRELAVVLEVIGPAGGPARGCLPLLKISAEVEYLMNY